MIPYWVKHSSTNLYSIYEFNVNSRPPHGAGHLDNIICLPRQPNRRLSIPFRVLRKGVVFMYVTWSDLIAFVAMLTA